MTGTRPDPDLPDDLDPTGVRALLANLPDPGPMPDDLVARITQSLVLEQQRRATGTEGGTAHPFGAPQGLSGVAAGDSETNASTADQQTHTTPQGVISLADERRRRRPGRTVIWLGGAAAVAMVATFSANQLLGDGSDSNLSAAVPGAHDAADDGAEAGGAADSDPGEEGAADAAPERGDSGSLDGEDDAAPEAPAPAGSGDDAAGSEDDAAGSADPGADIADVVFTASGTVALDESDLVETVSDWVATTPARGAGTWTAERAAECIVAHGLEISDADPVMVSDATWEGEPAMLVVTEHGDGGSAWVLTPDCGEVVSGPVTFP